MSNGGAHDLFSIDQMGKKILVTVETLAEIGFEPLSYSFFFKEVKGENKRGSYVFVTCLNASQIWRSEEEREQ